MKTFVSRTRTPDHPGRLARPIRPRGFELSRFSPAALAICLELMATGAAIADSTLLNVSYDPTRELYMEFNAAFMQFWKEKTGEDIKVLQSHGGSSKQARAVIDGLDADVVTLALAYDIDALHEHGGLVPGDWQKRLPHNSSPYVSTVAFLVRKGNPKNIKDWDDLVKDAVKVIPANPKTSGVARWNYLAAWGYALKKNHGDEAKAREFVSRFYKNVPVLDSGARGATTTFVERGIGDVLVNWENEVLLAGEKIAPDKFDVVVPPVSILTEPTVSVVDKVVDRRKTRPAALAYLEYLYSEKGQAIAAKNYYRPRNDAAAAKFPGRFKKVELFTIDEVFGGWQKAQKTHFADGGVFDQIYRPGR
ncbi:MAG: sulfate ABC transporter substrate-binding protein [Deltaproteobacteria bacterium]|nr:sulfate ABC transporter substrate-binding protein [Deltaproteobacteria bacterium]